MTRIEHKNKMRIILFNLLNGGFLGKLLYFCWQRFWAQNSWTTVVKELCWNSKICKETEQREMGQPISLRNSLNQSETFDRRMTDEHNDQNDESKYPRPLMEEWPMNTMTKTRRIKVLSKMHSIGIWIEDWTRKSCQRSYKTNAFTLLDALEFLCSIPPPSTSKFFRLIRCHWGQKQKSNTTLLTYICNTTLVYTKISP